MNPQQTYLQNQVSSSRPGDLIVMLYDGLIRFANEARQHLNAPGDEYEKAAYSVKRAVDILTELNSSLRPEVAPEFCTQLSSLYTFFMEELTKGLQTKNPDRIKSIIPLIDELRQSWQQAEKNISNATSTSQSGSST